MSLSREIGDREDEARTLTNLGDLRRRTGRYGKATAQYETALGMYRDLGDPSRYVERFIVASWADYLHQRARATLADQDVEARVREFVREGEAVTMQHYIAER